MRRGLTEPLKGMNRQDFIDINQTALDEVTEFLGEEFTYKGAAYTGIINDVEFTGELMSGGLIEGIATVIVVPLGVLPETPIVGALVKGGTKSLRIERIRVDETAIELTCVT